MIEWLRRLFGRQESADQEEPRASVPDHISIDQSMSETLHPAMGGPFVFGGELETMRWVAQQQAVEIAQSDFDPTVWDEATPVFETEQALASDHEALRDRLSNWVAGELTQLVSGLYNQAGRIAAALARLRALDRDLLVVTRDWNLVYTRIHIDHLETGRYYRLTSDWSKAFKWVLAVLFVAAEAAITGMVFNELLPAEVSNIGFVFAAGLILLLVAVPHFAALGWKEGITTHHSFEHQDFEDRDMRPPADLRRIRHLELADDRGFRWIVIGIGSVLVALIVVLSFVRASEANTEIIPGWAWVIFFLLLQLGISGYFFLREWLDHGTTSYNLHRLSQHREQLIEDREEAHRALARSISEYHETAEQVLFFLHQSPRWDSHIVATYHGTVHTFRHAISVAQPDLAPFIHQAPILSLGSAVPEHVDDGPEVRSMSDQIPTLRENNLLGREWLMRVVSDAIESEDEWSEEASEENASRVSQWLLVKSPTAILSEFLSRYFATSLPYETPEELLIAPGPPAWVEQLADLDQKEWEERRERETSREDTESAEDATTPDQTVDEKPEHPRQFRTIPTQTEVGSSDGGASVDQSVEAPDEEQEAGER